MSLGVRFFCFIALSLPLPASFRVFLSFFGAFAKLRKATIRFVMSVRLSVRMEQLGSHRTDFHEFWYLSIFRKSVEKIQVSFKSDKNKGYFGEDQYTFLIISCSVLRRMKNVSDKSSRATRNTHFMLSLFFRKSCRLWDNVENYCRAGQAIHDNMVHAYCMLGN
jgi:hypothetical protein